MEQYHRIAILENEFEAQILQSILEEQGIPHYFKSFYDLAYDGLFQRNLGWAAVFSPAEYEQEILMIIKSIRTET